MHDDDESSPEERREADLNKALAKPLWNKAVVWLARNLHPVMLEEAKVLRQLKPSGWMIPYHFTAGMMVRNELRANGFGEKEFEIDNLDNIYIELLNEALDY